MDGRLELERWDSNRRIQHFILYERVEVTPELVGTWVLAEDSAEDVDVTVTLNPDGTFFYRAVWSEGNFDMRGNWMHDSANLYIICSGISATWDGDPAPGWPDRLGARIAYAPIIANSILVSDWTQEPPAPHRWIEHKYGRYRALFNKQTTE